jgi:hypothetical protein
MKKLYTLATIALLFWGCSKTETPEPEPAEQVIGTYAVDKITESIKYDTSPNESAETINLPFKNSKGDELSATLDVAKKASNMVTMVFVQTLKYAATGKSDTNRDAFDTVELKKIEGSAGQFEMLDAGKKFGTIGNNNILLEEIIADKDSLGRKFTYTLRISGKKK